MFYIPISELKIMNEARRQKTPAKSPSFVDTGRVHKISLLNVVGQDYGAQLLLTELDGIYGRNPRIALAHRQAAQ